MDETFTMETVGGITTFRFPGKVEAADICRAADAAARTGASWRQMYVFEGGVDLGHSDLLEISVHTKRAWTTRVRVALVGLDDLSYGQARVFRIYRQEVGQDFQAFQSEPEALAWLQAEDGPAPEMQDSP